jgi:NADH-quinone oxidoreductase subunit E
MAVELDLVPRLCQRHVESESSLVMLLQDVQAQYGFLPKLVLEAISAQLKVPLSRLYTLATFYRSFSLEPRGRHEVWVCTGTACHVRGAGSLLKHLQRVMGIEAGETTSDGEYTLLSVNCLGACALGPVLVVDGKYHGKMTLEKAEKVLAKLRKPEGKPA